MTYCFLRLSLVKENFGKRFLKKKKESSHTRTYARLNGFSASLLSLGFVLKFELESYKKAQAYIKS